MKLDKYSKMKPDKSQVLLSPEDEDLRQCRFGFTTGYIKIFSDKYVGNYIHTIIAERIGLVAKRVNGFQIDHTNRNKLDNRRENLRLISAAANTNNCQKIINSKGYSWIPARKKYKSTIKINGTQIVLGHFNSPEEAREVYVKAKNKRLIELGLLDLVHKE